jgi:hypothetical protein
MSNSNKVSSKMSILNTLIKEEKLIETGSKHRYLKQNLILYLLSTNLHSKAEE